MAAPDPMAPSTWAPGFGPTYTLARLPASPLRGLWCFGFGNVAPIRALSTQTAALTGGRCAWGFLTGSVTVADGSDGKQAAAVVGAYTAPRYKPEESPGRACT